MDVDIKKLLARMQDMTENHEAFIKNEATAIEKEVSLAVKHHLTHKRFPGYKLYIPSGFPKTLRHPTTDAFLTDLDGVYILTTNPDVADYNDELIDPTPHRIQGQKERKKLASTLKHHKHTFESILVIVEAKHYMTKDRVLKKLEQLQSIEHFLSMAKDTTATTKRFQKNVHMFGFDKYSPKVLLYLGGPLWDDEAMALVNSSDKKQHIGIIKTIGSRYGIADVSTSFILRGGSKPKTT